MFNTREPFRPKVSSEERRAREQREANLRRTREAGPSLAEAFGIKSEGPAPVPKVKRKTNRPKVNYKHRELYVSLLSLGPGQVYEWTDAPRGKVVHTLLTYWRRRLGLNVSSFEESGRRFIRRVA